MRGWVIILMALVAVFFYFWMDPTAFTVLANWLQQMIQATPGK
jgi:hypothetical protein